MTPLSAQDTAFYPSQLPRLLEGCGAWKTLLSLLEDATRVEVFRGGRDRPIDLSGVGGTRKAMGLLMGIHFMNTYRMGIGDIVRNSCGFLGIYRIDTQPTDFFFGVSWKLWLLYWAMSIYPSL